MFEYIDSAREKARRASRRDTTARRKPAYSGKHGTPLPFKWGGRIVVSNVPDFEYENEIGGFHSIKFYFTGWGADAKDDGGYSYVYAQRWLKAQVGRLWDDVYSDVCRRFDARSYRGREVRRSFHKPSQGYANNVTTHCYIDVDGSVRDSQSHLVGGLYVHPETGILCWAPEYNSTRDWRDRVRRYTSDEIAVHGEEAWFTGQYHTKRRPVDYLFQYLECGRSPKNRFKTWFRVVPEVKVERYWYTCFDQTMDDAYYQRRGYRIHPETGAWGETRVITRNLTHKYTCSRAELAWIADFTRKTLEL